MNNVTDAKSILARVLQKFNINEDVEKYSLFTTLSDGKLFIYFIHIYIFINILLFSIT